MGDFGYAREIKDTDQAKTWCGSLLTMAPEIIEDKSYTNAADIYSLGAVFY